MVACWRLAERHSDGIWISVSDSGERRPITAGQTMGICPLPDPLHRVPQSNILPFYSSIQTAVVAIKISLRPR